MFNRRKFLTTAAGGIMFGALPAIPALTDEASLQARIKAIAFDAFPIFDPRPVFALVERLYPGKGAALSNEWRTRQFEYTWLRVAAQRYVDFWQVTQQALEFAADKLNLKLTQAQRDELLNAYLGLKAWPDVLPTLASLKALRFRLAILSNFTPGMLEANVQSAGLSGFFEQVLSTDRAKSYKPDPRAYQLGTEALKLERQEILFVAFAGWDAAGAKSFGYPTYWLNRQKLPVERLDAAPDGVGESLRQFLEFLKQGR
jgi:2-haloacid dehalogenase